MEVVLIRRIGRYAFLPLFLAVFDGATYLDVAYGQSPWILIPIMAAALVTATLAERLIPYSTAFNTPRGDVGTDTWHAVANESVTLLMLVLATKPFFSLHLWPYGSPFAAQLLLAILILDFGVWIGHFLSHKFALLWRFHAVHHRVERIYSLNGLMKHPVSLIVEQIPAAVLLVGAGLPNDVALALTACTFVQLLVQHSNADYHVPGLDRLLATNAVHRFHHLADPALGSCNYGFFTNIWDRVFGTYRFEPERRFAVADLGLGPDSNMPPDYVGQLLAPFAPTRQGAAGDSAAMARPARSS
jgi:sterol desaturase/sphingolipid hydroxylase (fatty acid hydroxylase superfamily)